VVLVRRLLHSHPDIVVRSSFDLAARASVSTRVVDGYTDTVRRHDALEFGWKPPRPWLPALQAILTVRPHAPPGSELQLSCTYVPPFGLLGKVFDLKRLLRRGARDVIRGYRRCMIAKRGSLVIDHGSYIRIAQSRKRRHLPSVRFTADRFAVLTVEHDHDVLRGVARRHDGIVRQWRIHPGIVALAP
jgi:hypothetical protein